MILAIWLLTGCGDDVSPLNQTTDTQRVANPDSPDLRDGLSYLNDLRHGMGLPTFRHLKSLEEAEKNHAYYLADVYKKYGVILGHKEDNTTYPSPYYTGHTTLSRARHMHYDGDYVLGGVSYSPGNKPMIHHIRALMTAIYHRLLITNPGADEVGLYGSKDLPLNTGQVDVGIDVETQVKNELASPSVIVYPFDGETDVSRYFMGETPDPLKEQADYEDGIRYEDFIQLVASRGDFKEAFEDIMFSTKVVITDKKEFIDFIKKLSTEGFNEMALAYLDAASGTFGNDQEIYELYHMTKRQEK